MHTHTRNFTLSQTLHSPYNHQTVSMSSPPNIIEIAPTDANARACLELIHRQILRAMRADSAASVNDVHLHLHHTLTHLRALARLLGSEDVLGQDPPILALVQEPRGASVISQPKTLPTKASRRAAAAACSRKRQKTK